MEVMFESVFFFSTGVVAAGISREQQAKMLQQQQQHMLRAQQQMRPPPPEYKARFAGAGVGVVGAGVGARRPPAAPRAFPPHARQYSPEWRHVLMQQQAAARHQFPHHHQGMFDCSLLQRLWYTRKPLSSLAKGCTLRQYSLCLSYRDAHLDLTGSILKRILLNVQG